MDDNEWHNIKDKNMGVWKLEASFATKEEMEEVVWSGTDEDVEQEKDVEINNDFEN